MYMSLRKTLTMCCLYWMLCGFFRDFVRSVISNQWTFTLDVDIFLYSVFIYIIFVNAKTPTE